MPVATGPGQTAHLQPQHEAHVIQANLGQQSLESRTPGDRLPALTEIIVDDQHPRRGPSQSLGPLAKPILHLRRLAVFADLFGAGLAHVDKGIAVQMPCVHLGTGPLSLPHTRGVHCHRGVLRRLVKSPHASPPGDRVRPGTRRCEPVWPGSRSWGVRADVPRVPEASATGSCPVSGGGHGVACEAGHDAPPCRCLFAHHSAKSNRADAATIGRHAAFEQDESTVAFCLLAHAQPLAFRRLARARWRSSRVHAASDQHACETVEGASSRERVRPSLSRALQVFPGGNRRLLLPGRSLRGAECPACKPRVSSGIVALVEFAPCGARRPGVSHPLDVAFATPHRLAATCQPTANGSRSGGDALLRQSRSALRRSSLGHGLGQAIGARMHGSAPWKTEETIVGLPRLLVLSVLLTFRILEPCADSLTPDGLGSCRKRRNFGAHRSLVQSCGCRSAALGSPDLILQIWWLSPFTSRRQLSRLTDVARAPVSDRTCELRLNEFHRTNAEISPDSRMVSRSGRDAVLHP